MDQFGCVVQCGLRSDHRYLRLDVHLNQIGRIPGGIGAIGHHHGDGLAHIADIPIGKSPQRRIGHLVADQRGKHRPGQPIQLCGGQDIDNARMGLGRLGIDAPNHSSSHTAADEPGMEHSRHSHVGDVGSPSGGEPPIFSAENALSDEPSGAH